MAECPFLRTRTHFSEPSILSPNGDVVHQLGLGFGLEQRIDGITRSSIIVIVSIWITFHYSSELVPETLPLVLVIPLPPYCRLLGFCRPRAAWQAPLRNVLLWHRAVDRLQATRLSQGPFGVCAFASGL